VNDALRLNLGLQMLHNPVFSRAPIRNEDMAFCHLTPQLQAGNVVIVRNEELAAMVALRGGPYLSASYSWSLTFEKSWLRQVLSH
jgi:hypothetical protein